MWMKQKVVDQTISKEVLYGLLYDYMREYGWNGAKLIFMKPDLVDLFLRNETHRKITTWEAERILNQKLQVKRKRGRGYIGRSISANAQKAYEHGLKPISRFTTADLKACGFDYSLEFFKWLVKNWGIKPEEIHHTSAACRRTYFYGEATVRHLVRWCNLELLYQIYRKEITIPQAMNIRKIQFAKVQIADSLIGGRFGKPIDMDCIICDRLVYYSPKMCFRESDSRVHVLERYDARPVHGFKNERLNSFEEKLLKFKTGFYRRYIKE